MDSRRSDTRIYKDWASGQVFDATRRAPRNDLSYSAINMQVYDSGALGPRPWLKKWATTGLVPATDLNLSTYANVQYRERTGGASAFGELYVYSVSVGGASTAAYYYDFAASQWNSASGIGTVTAQTSAIRPAKRLEWGSAVFDTIGSNQADSLGPDDFIFLGQKHWDGSTATAIDWGDGSVFQTVTNSVFYRGRLWGWAENTSGKNRLYYTDAADYKASASSAQFIDISASSGGVFIQGCWAVRDSLLISLSNDDWYSFTGTPDTGTLRFIGKYVSPTIGAAAVALNNAVYFMAPLGDGLCVATPSGVDTVTNHTIKPWITDYNWAKVADYRAMSSPTKNAVHLTFFDATFLKNWVGVERINENWNLSIYGHSDYNERSTGDLGQLRDCAAVNYGNAWAFLTYGTYATVDAGTLKHIQLYTRDITLNRPSRSDDYWSSNLEGTPIGGGAYEPNSGTVRLSPYGPESGEEVRVSKVTLDFTYWNADTTVYPEIEVDLKIRKLDNLTTAAVFTDTTSFAAFNNTNNLPELADNVNLRGAQARFVFNVDMTIFYPDLFIELCNINSMALNRVIVDYEVRPDNLTTRSS